MSSAPASILAYNINATTATATITIGSTINITNRNNCNHLGHDLHLAVLNIDSQKFALSLILRIAISSIIYFELIPK